MVGSDGMMGVIDLEVLREGGEQGGLVSNWLLGS